MIRFVCGVALLLLAALPAWGQDKNSPDAALEQLLAEARENCTNPTDRLSKVLCGGRIRIGVRDYYPLFSTREGDERSGYEVDVAHAIAKRLGVEPDFASRQRRHPHPDDRRGPHRPGDRHDGAQHPA